jgi:hypothetical protein
VGDTTDSYLPTYWYVNGHVVDSNKGGFMIHVDTTTTFVVSLDVCGHITYDTMTVWVGYDLTGTPFSKRPPTILPNPVQDFLTIEHAAGSEFTIYNLVGKEVYHTLVRSDREILNIASLQGGVYIAELITGVGEKRSIRLVKNP